ncbi:hypothetical protein C8Q74DRAFT_122555 [Fomes fomentarius]|nr:hypothetical protein C8Q74DRAFT_122555 [Fomes fomentarius]
MALSAAGNTSMFFEPSHKFPPLDNTFGAMLIGTFVGLIQYGWTAHQCYRYFRVYSEDTWRLKCLVTSILTLETLHSMLCIHICYYYLTTNYSNPGALEEGVWSINLLGACTGVVMLVSQMFFLRRVYMIGRRVRPLVAFCAVLLLVELGFAIAVTADTFLHSTLHTDDQAWMNSTGVGTAALADTLLTAALIYSLHQSRTGVKRTDGLIDILILYSINTGLVTGIFNTLSFIFAIAMPDTLIYAGIDIVATKLYGNSLMAVLNSRRDLAERTEGVRRVHTTSIDMSVLRWTPAESPRTGRLSTLMRTIDISVTRDMVTTDDTGFEPRSKDPQDAV